MYALPDPVFVLDELGRFTYASRSWQKVVGLASEALLGTLFHALAVEEDRTQVKLEVAGVCGVGPASWRARFRIDSPPAGSRWVEVHAARTGAHDGRLPCVVGSLRDVTVEMEQQQALQEQALLDPVIGIPNRLLFLDRLRKRLLRAERRNEPPFALALMDLDDFKAINDEHGHVAGDEALEVVATRLVGAVRSADTVARFGGDEFVVLLDEVASAEAALKLVRRMHGDLTQPATIGRRPLRLSGSFGVFVTEPDAALPSVRELLTCADHVMYRAKREGTGVALHQASSRGPGRVPSRRAPRMGLDGS